MTNVTIRKKLKLLQMVKIKLVFFKSRGYKKVFLMQPLRWAFLRVFLQSRLQS